MDHRLLELLVCPICKGPLDYQREAGELVCVPDRLAFPIRDGMALMVEGDARPLGATAGDSAAAAAPPRPNA